MKKYTWKHLILTIFVMGVIVFIMYAGLVLRDYKLVFDGGIKLVAKSGVPGAPGFVLDAGSPEKLTVRITENGAIAYDVQVSSFKNMFFSRTYRTQTGLKSIGLMKGGKTYYVRVRSIGEKPGTTRKVTGQWSGVKSVKIKEPRKTNQSLLDRIFGR